MLRAGTLKVADCSETCANPNLKGVVFDNADWTHVVQLGETRATIYVILYMGFMSSASGWCLCRTTGIICVGHTFDFEER